MATRALMEIAPAGSQAPAVVIRQGTRSRLSGLTAAERLPLLDHLLAGRTAETEVDVGGRRWVLRCHVPPADVGLVSAEGALLAGTPVRESLLLAGTPQRLETALRETGLLAGCDLDATPPALTAGARMEATFVQAWMREPQWLVLEPDAASDATARRLAEAFHLRFPLRAITCLGGVATMGPFDPDFDFLE